MKQLSALLTFVIAASAGAADWRIAEPGWKYEFPRDHHAHRDFKTEWWYFTGNVVSQDGERFGYELTFFRNGITPEARRNSEMSRFIVGDLKFAHFALTDVTKGKFDFEQKVSRGAFDDAGFDGNNRLAWIDEWALTFDGENTFNLAATDPKGRIHLELRAKKAAVVHGENGTSVKATSNGAASHYYSISRLTTSGELEVGGKNYRVQGDSWFDHEWGTSQLGKGQAGWDWVCVQWQDGTELMLYQMRLKNGEPDATSSGTLIAANGTAIHLRNTDFRMKPIGFWRSNVNGTRYPTSWEVALPDQGMLFVIRPLLENQELAFGSLTYWEGAIDARGTKHGQAINGSGYLELTGYAGRLSEVLGH